MIVGDPSVTPVPDIFDRHSGGEAGAPERDRAEGAKGVVMVSVSGFLARRWPWRASMV
jgi:hypothetical protein